jgi:20S proteasome alpha/beta subunit
MAVTNEKQYGTRSKEALEYLKEHRRKTMELKEIFERGVAALNRHAKNSRQEKVS